MDPLVRLQAALVDHYRLDRELGQGGMATVYLAEDLKHHRKVAVKVLRPELASSIGPERFAREIEVAARLQHPHILGLLDSGTADGFYYYVMPYVEGETLRDRLVRAGELPVPEAVRLLSEVADALAVAHRAGVVHRDIKPENVLLSGRHAMVMDFGIARAITEAAGPGRLTTVGVALGTPAYMAPEQAAAEPSLDHRVDIYALGVLGYELLTGQQPFTGGSAQQILAAQVTRTPESILERRPSVPPALAAVIMRCLEKRPADRYQTADELVDGARTAGGAERRDDPDRHAGALRALLGASRSRPPSWRWPCGGARWHSADPAPAARAHDVQRCRSHQCAWHRVPAGALARRQSGGVRHSTRRANRADGPERRRGLGGKRTAPGRGDAGHAAVSELEPGRRVHPVLQLRPGGVHSGERSGRLGGAARVAEIPRQSPWTAWSRDGTHAAFVINDSIFVYTVADRGTRLLAVHAGPPEKHSLAWSPDGRWIAYVNTNGSWPDSPNTQNTSIWIVDAADGKRVAVTAEDHLNVSPVWLDAGHLLFVSNRDGAREVFGVQVGSAGPRGDAQKVAGGTDAYSISLSAAGNKLAVAKYQVRQNVRVYMIGASGTVSIRDGRLVTSGTQVVEGHDVSRDGKWLVYDSNLRGNADIYKLRLDGGEPIPLVTSPTDEFGPAWSPDGREVVFWADSQNADVFVVSAEGGTPVQLTNSSAGDAFAHWSPDGLRIAFLSRRTGRWEAWLLSRERVGGPWHEAVQLTDFGCGSTIWAPDGSGVLCAVAERPRTGLCGGDGAVAPRPGGGRFLRH